MKYNKLSKSQLLEIGILFLLNIIICIFIYKLLRSDYNVKYVLKLMTFKELRVLMGVYCLGSAILCGIYLSLKDTYFLFFKSYNKIRLLFFCTMLISILVMIILGYITHGEVIRSFLHIDREDVFMDYYNSIQYGRKPYSRQVIYPPLINVFYSFLGRFCLMGGMEPRLFRVNQLASITFLFYTMAAYGFLFYALKKVSSDFFSKSETNLLFFLMLFSLPYLYLMERANSLIMVISLLILYCVLYDSYDSRYKYLAMIMLSIAASIKITPCLFGILFLRDKDISSALKCLFVGLLVFNIPFILTDGNLLVLIDNIRNTTQAFQGVVIDEFGFKHYVGNGNYVNLGNTMTILSRLLNYDFAGIGKFLNIFIFCASITITLFAKKVERWQIMALLCGVIVLCPGFSAIYNLTYYTLPLVCFLGSKPRFSKKNVFYTLLLIMVFIPIINIKIPYLQYVSWTDIYPMRLSTIVESFSILILSVAIILEILYKEFRGRFWERVKNE